MTYRTIGVEIDTHIYQRAISKASSQGKTINEVVVDLLKAYVKEDKKTVSKPTTTSPIKSAKKAPSQAAPTATVVAPVQTYVVQSGDTLGSISRKVYGNARKYPLIQKANNIVDPRRIWVGQNLVIPPLDEKSASQPKVISSNQKVAPNTGVTPTKRASTTATKNPAPPIRFAASPNFNRRPRPEIGAIVMHATANGSLEGVVNWFNRADAQVSAHYTIGKNGDIVQHVKDEHRAWHAGHSTWKGRSDLNSWSIGIELVNWNNGADPYPETQHQATVNLVAYLCSKHNINPDFIVAHYDVSPRRKTDPKNYDMERLRQEVTARL